MASHSAAAARLRTTGVSRADLLRFLAEAGLSGLDAMAAYAGYSRGEPAVETRPAAPAPIATEFPPDVGPAVQGSEPAGRVERLAAPFFHVTEHIAVPPEVRVSEAPEWFRKAAPFRDPIQANPQGRSPPLEPLTPWRRLWPLLRAALGRVSASGRPDLERAVALVARGRVLRRLPFRRCQRWAPVAQILVDYDPRLLPFWDDFNALLGGLKRLRGRAGLETLMLEHGPGGPCWPSGAAPREGWRPYRLPEAGTPVLILSDLGCLGETDARAAWARLGRRLTAAHLASVALMPCPPRWWDRAVLRGCFPVCWDRSARLPGRLGGRRPAIPEPQGLGRARADPGAELLLSLLAPAVRVEPALLRAVRLGLPPGLADVGSEAAVWLHPAVTAGLTAFAYAGGEAVERYRAAFRALPDELHKVRRLAAEQIKLHHAHLPGAVRFEERALIAELSGEPDPDVEEFFARLIRTLDAAPEPERQRMIAWVHRFAGRQHAASWNDPVRTAVYVRALSTEIKTKDAAQPDGLDLNLAAWALDPPALPRRYSLWQRGEVFELEPTSARLSPSTGSPVVEIRIAASVVQVLEDSASPAGIPRWRSVALAGPQPRASIPVPEQGGLTLKTDHDTVRIESMTRPAWASAMGRDSEGLFVEIGEGEAARQAYWLNPGTYPPHYP